MITEHAPAKINLYLHVGGVRADGLHELASLFVFTEHGDRITVGDGEKISLQISGPFADELSAFPIEENLVWRAAEALREHVGKDLAAGITLEKNLPIAAGIGGGSADAAAALRALVRHWRLEIPSEDLLSLAFNLGADVPACLERAPVHVSGAGELIEPGPSLPPLWVCLANPLAATLTGPIFAQFDRENPAPTAPEFHVAPLTCMDDVLSMMSATKNDLEGAAIAQTPVIAEMIGVLKSQRNVIAARMSGSGATCFALFPTENDADNAKAVAEAHGWWAMASKLAIG